MNEIARMDAVIAKIREEHCVEVDKLNAEIERLTSALESSQSAYDARSLDYWELSGKVDAYEMCIRAFTGMKGD